MKIKVEGCCGANSRFYFRLTPPDGERLFVEGFKWTRNLAIAARNEIVRIYAVKRQSIRFEHV